MMYSVELEIPSDTSALGLSHKRSEHHVQQYLYQALSLVAHQFFAETGLVGATEARLPQLMVELSCLRTEQLFTTQAMCLEARLSLTSNQGFSIDYALLTNTKARELAAWRSHHVFYDFACEQPFSIEGYLPEEDAGSVSLNYPHILSAKEPAPITQFYR